VLYELAAAPTTLLVAFLTGHEKVEPLAGDRVSSYKIDTPLSRIQLTMVPGDLGSPGFEIYQYQADCWGPTDAVDDVDQAEELARTVCAAIPDLIGTSGVTTAFPTVRPFSLPDPETGRARFVCQIQFQISPEA
jgi:hypothetical protein